MRAVHLVIVRRDQKASIAYPKDEDPFDTRDRVKRKEKYGDEWRYYVAAVKYESGEFESKNKLIDHVLYRQSMFRFRTP